MNVCDRCLAKKYNRLEVKFEKVAERGRKNRLMLVVPLELCEACIDDLLKEFGKFKVAFLKQGDETEGKP